MAKKDFSNMKSDSVQSLGKVAIGMIAVGLTAGLALIAGAKAVGDAVFGDKSDVSDAGVDNDEIEDRDEAEPESEEYRD